MRLFSYNNMCLSRLSLNFWIIVIFVQGCFTVFWDENVFNIGPLKLTQIWFPCMLILTVICKQTGLAQSNYR